MSRAAATRILLPWTRSCLVCGQDNPIGLRARSWSVGERVELPFTPRPEHAGWSDVIHGGFVATVLDEVMTWAAILGSAKPVYAADFTVRLQAPLRAGLACTASARLTQHRRRIFDIESWLADAEGTVYALLIRVEQRGLVDVEKVSSEKGPPRKVYSLNTQGQQYLEEFWGTWSFLAERLEQLREGGK